MQSPVAQATAGSSSTGTSTSSVTPADEVGFNALVPRYSATQPATTATSTSADTSTDPDQAADDAYWAAQPPAVQALRTMTNQTQRTELATQLASEGYTIDNAIMVWGWDAGQVTSMRESAGYTWVPSLMQANVTAAPGLTAPGMTSYDPTNPPAGSITVS